VVTNAIFKILFTSVLPDESEVMSFIFSNNIATVCIKDPFFFCNHDAFESANLLDPETTATETTSILTAKIDAVSGVGTFTGSMHEYVYDVFFFSKRALELKIAHSLS